MLPYEVTRYVATIVTSRETHFYYKLHYDSFFSVLKSELCIKITFQIKFQEPIEIYCEWFWLVAQQQCENKISYANIVY